MQSRLLCLLLALIATLIVTGPTVHARAAKLTIGLPGGSAAHDPAMIDRFAELHPDIEVETIVYPWTEFSTKLMLMLVTDTAPDVWYGEAGRAFEWHRAGFTVDLGPFVERDLDLDDYFMLDAARDPLSGVWTGVPSDFQVTSLFYNTLHLASAGIPFPDESWIVQDLLEAARKLGRPSESGEERWGFNMQPEYITAGWMLWIKLLGGHVLDETRTRSRLNHTDTVSALREMGAIIHEARISPSPADTAFPPWQAVAGFQTGTTSMMFNIYSWNRYLLDLGTDHYDVAVVPAAPTGERLTTSVPNVWMINRRASGARQEAAWEWIKFQVGAEAQAIRMASGAGVPVNREVAADFALLPAPPTNRRIYLESFAFARTLEENAVWERYRRAAEEALLPFWSGDISAEEAAMRADREVGLILRELS